jgi:Pal1 cell morphology protein
MGSKEAYTYMIDPLVAPDPSDETGLNTKFRSTFDPATESRENLVRNQKLHDQKMQATHSPKHSSPLSPTGGRLRASSNASPPTSPSNATASIRRGKSLNHGHHYDPQQKRRSRRVSLQPIDTIDTLDFSPGGPYHHEGPYDATLISRNLNQLTSPVAAVADSNAAALKATPRENIMDAVLKHRPLDGTASVPPGVTDGLGRKYSYEESNMMAETGYGKWQWIGEVCYSGHKSVYSSSHP